MANYPQELAQDAVCQSHIGHMTGLWFLPARPLRLNTNEWINIWQEWVLNMNTHVHMCIYDRSSPSFSLSEKFFRQKFWRKSEHAFYVQCPFFFRNSCRLWGNVEKYCRAGQATNDNMAHAHCILDTKGYRHTLRICNFFPLQQWLHERASTLRTLLVLLRILLSSCVSLSIDLT